MWARAYVLRKGLGSPPLAPLFEIDWQRSRRVTRPVAEGSNSCDSSPFGERWILQSLSKTITIPLDEWRVYQGEHRLCYNFGPAGVKSCLYVDVRAVSAPVL